MFFRGQTIGKYRILSSLGSGGFGTVYLAEDTWIDKKVALKVPHKQNLDSVEMLLVRNLQRNLLVDPRVFGEIHGAEAAAADGRQDAVFAEGLTPEEH